MRGYATRDTEFLKTEPATRDTEFIFKLFFKIRSGGTRDTEFIFEKDGQGCGQSTRDIEFISGKDGQGDYRVFPTALDSRKVSTRNREEF